jgi:hypothetical protein
MFDVSACSHLHLLQAPAVTVEVLCGLKALLTTFLESRDGLMQAEHHSLLNMGGANAKSDKAADGSTQFVSAAESRCFLGQATQRNPATDHTVTGPVASPAWHKKPGPPPNQGGEQ